MDEREIPALDQLQAVLLITKHLDTLLPFLLALRRIPADLPQRVGLLQTIAREIAGEPDLARDWYTALELMTGEDLSNTSAGELLHFAIEQSRNARWEDVWRVAFRIGLIDEGMLDRWALFAGLTDRKGRKGREEVEEAVKAEVDTEMR